MTYIASLLECVSAPVFALEPGQNGTFHAWNRAMAQVTGLAAQDVVGRTSVEVLGPEGASLSHAPPGLFRVARFGLTVVERHEDFIVGTLQDAERETYLGMAAHDLRSPLRNILFLAETALSDTGPNPMVSKIASVARNSLLLTSDLISCAQSVGLGEQPLTQISLKPTVDQIVSTLEADDLEIDCRQCILEIEKPVFIIVLRNLIDNAIRHGGGTMKRIAISADVSDACVEIRVSDNGKGFKDSTLAFLSGGEFRVESGYGLMGLRRLLRARGGRIHVEPGETGKGSAVIVTLPGSIGSSDQVAIAS